MKRWTLALALALAAAIALPAAATDRPRAAFGDIRLAYDPALWTFAGADSQFSFTCIDPVCDRQVVNITIASEVEASCTPSALIAATEYLTQASSRSVSPGIGVGVAGHIATVAFNCRGVAGSPVFACAHHAGRVYHFSMPAERCSIPLTATQAVFTLLNGISDAALRREHAR